MRQDSVSGAKVSWGHTNDLESTMVKYLKLNHALKVPDTLRFIFASESIQLKASFPR